MLEEYEPHHITEEVFNKMRNSFQSALEKVDSVIETGQFEDESLEQYKKYRANISERQQALVQWYEERTSVSGVSSSI